MSRNGSGVYSLPAGNPVVTGTTISSSWANTTLSDIATALTGSVAADGQTAMTGNLQMGNNKITGLAVATASGDALSYGQAATISALTVSGAFAANGGATLGDASGDALTINSSAVSIPNGLNFDSNTLVIDATNNNVGIGTSSPNNSYRLDIQSTQSATRIQSTTGTNIAFLTLANTGTDMYVGREGSAGGALATGTSAYSGVVTVNGAYPLAFGTNGAERMRIDSSGNVGIGTSSPSAKLQVEAPTAQLFLTSSTGTNFCLYRAINSGGTFYVGRENSTGSNFGAAYSALLWSTGAYPMVFATNDAERMRIDSSGNLLVGTTTSGGWTTVSKTESVSSGATYAVSGYRQGSDLGSAFIARVDSTTPGFMRFYYSTSLVGSITTNGTTTAYNTSSDYRLKENIAPMADALAKVSQLKPVTYSWKSDGSAGEGFIAHELQAVVPDCVTGEKDAVDAEGKPVYQGIDTSFLVATLTSAIQELNAKVDAQAARIAVLESK